MGRIKEGWRGGCHEEGQWRGHGIMGKKKGDGRAGCRDDSTLMRDDGRIGLSERSYT